MSIDDLTNDIEALLFYISLASYADLLVLQTLGPVVYHLIHLYDKVQKLSVENQFFFTLMKLSQNRTSNESGRIFGISKTTVDNIWITRVNFLARQFKDITFWSELGNCKFSFSLSQIYFNKGHF